LSNPDAADRMGRRGRRLVVERHDWDALARDTLGVLEGVLDDGGASGASPEAASTATTSA
jgi:glycosyltransferase involved in cell wall biosynthesis